jgi:threonine/homoserine efflux transporter RhtA
LATKDGRVGHFAVHNPGRRRGEMMTNAMVTFGIAVGGTSLIYYALMTLLPGGKAAALTYRNSIF